MAVNEAQPKSPHRAIVWILIVVASIVLLLSLTANWVQREVLDNDQFKSNTDQILADEHVQNALSVYLVDQLYASVDVQAELESELPSSVSALSAPLAALSRRVAQDVSEQALANPSVQALVANAVATAHKQFTELVRNEKKYVSTTGGEVTVDYGAVLADLAARIGVDPSTITQIQNVVQSFSKDLKDALTNAQNQLKSVQSELAQVQQGTLSPELQQNLEKLQTQLSNVQTKLAGVEKTVTKAESKAPAAVKSRLADLDARITDVDTRLTDRDQDISAVLEDPSQANVQQLDTALTALDQRITQLLNRPVVQNPGQLVVVKSDQLDAVLTGLRAMRNLGIVLPLLALVLYLGALYLAHGWRRQAMIAIGGGILITTLLVLFVRRVTGGAVVDSVAASETVRPAVRSVWNIISEGLRERALFSLVIGVGFIFAGLIAGPARWAVATRRWLAPHLRDQPVLVYAVLGVLFLLWLTLIPVINNWGQVVVVLALAALAVVGVEALRRQTAQEFPARSASP